ncbi:CCA tRNA nucleotidyltransferase [Minwuia thermotolerans]|uniref:CCA tRNA nucleotidyltransferase n=1 Tax=Minwuia thermotolerans TaxID=2056226 RepID=A0A2M9G6Q7_9PROT|nr:CCA tRNA nucleotidyltransferase [Minwuia thermotolerans]
MTRGTPPAPPPWRRNRAAGRVLAVLEAAGGEARYVGGCVRDWVLGRPTGDIDIATTLVPERVIEALQQAGIKAVPTGVEHGTVTAALEGQGVEVTTLRRDVETDGRRAVVGFTTDWAEDAARRDFTVNALYADQAGQLYDPTGRGLGDARARRLCFVGDAATRIREDYLRILRFFRFHAQIGLDLDPPGLEACAALAEGLEQLSAERVWHETKRLLAGPWAAETLHGMAESGILGRVLPECRDLSVSDALPGACDAELRLAALLPKAGAGAAEDVARRWKLSRREAARVVNAVEPLPDDAGTDAAAIRRIVYHSGGEAAADRLALAHARGGAVTPEAAETARNWRPPRFPLSGRHATARGIEAGPAVGELLKAVENWWIAGDFTADREACLAELERRISETESPGSSPPRS